MLIKSLKAKSIKDSRSALTIEVSINGQKASAPSGKSTGKFETHCYKKSLTSSINDINNLKELIGFKITKFSDLQKIESLIKRKFHLSSAKQFGANTLIALEIAALKALAQSRSIPLWQIINPEARKFPTPLGNAIGGGLHSHNKEAPEFQEFLIIPKGRTFKDKVELMTKIHKELSFILKSTSLNDEGAWQTSLNNEQVLETLSKFPQIKIGIDIAASSFYKKNKYNYKSKSLTTKQQISYINNLIKRYNLYYIEDPLQEQDFSGFSKLSKKALITGDDLTATQISRLKKAFHSHSINAMIIKPNQNGSLIELKEIFQLCKKHKIKTILSHRSGETLDNALADLAFGFQADFIKTGIATKFRQAKLKRMIEIEKSLQ